jgi:putative transposase
MPRIARIVVPGVPHHVTQRGTDRQTVFHCRQDRVTYLALLKQHSHQAEVDVLAYCLMPNHVHLIVVPTDKESLAVALRRTHGRYAQYLNARRSRTGHLWQNRFFSCPMEHGHLWSALSYVERNPVRARLVERPEQYEWSSASDHLTGHDRLELLNMRFWQEQGGIVCWKSLLGTQNDEREMLHLERATYAGRPLGTKEFCAWARRQARADASRVAGGS